jgi:hypothetical protein
LESISIIAGIESGSVSSNWAAVIKIRMSTIRDHRRGRFSHTPSHVTYPATERAAKA